MVLDATNPYLIVWASLRWYQPKHSEHVEARFAQHGTATLLLLCKTVFRMNEAAMKRRKKNENETRNENKNEKYKQRKKRRKKSEIQTRPKPKQRGEEAEKKKRNKRGEEEDKVNMHSRNELRRKTQNTKTQSVTSWLSTLDAVCTKFLYMAIWARKIIQLLPNTLRWRTIMQ